MARGSREWGWMLLSLCRHHLGNNAKKQVILQYGKRVRPSTVSTLVLDARQFIRRAELAPTDAGVTVVNEGRMGGALMHTAFPFGAVLPRCLSAPRRPPGGMPCT